LTYKLNAFTGELDLIDAVASHSITDLNDVTITSPADNEILAYDSGTSEWINQTPTEAGFDARYVEIAGDTMTGALILDQTLQVAGNTTITPGSLSVNNSFIQSITSQALFGVLTLKGIGAETNDLLFNFGSDAAKIGLTSTTATEIALKADNLLLSMGAAGATDYYQTFDDTDAQFFTSGDFIFTNTTGFTGMGETNPAARLHLKTSATNNQTMFRTQTSDSVNKVLFETDGAGHAFTGIYDASGNRDILLYSNGTSVFKGGDLALQADNLKFQMGAAGATDYYQTFNNTDAIFYSSGVFEFTRVAGQDTTVKLTAPTSKSALLLFSVTDFPNTMLWGQAGAAGNILTGTASGDMALSLRSGGAIRMSADTGFDAAEGMSILENGNVGIGTTNPGALLDVVGTIRVSGSFPHRWESDFNGIFQATTGLIEINVDGGFTNVRVTSGDFQLLNDNQELQIGAAGSADSYLSFDSARLDMFSVAGFDFMTAADTDLIMNFIGTTNSGLFTWMEDEDYFKFSDDVNLDTLSASQLVKTDASKTLVSTVATVDVPIAISMYDAEPARASETHWNGGLLKLDDAAAVNSGAPFNISTKGSGKILIVVNAGGDLVGDITLTGTSVDRNDQSQGGGATSVITLTGATTDNSVADDGNGNTVHLFTKAYITDKWFTGVVQITTADVAITDMDVYHVSFEQLNDSANITLNTFDANIFTANAAAEFDAYLFTIHVTGDECDVHNEAKLNIGTGTYATQAALANKYFRLREGNIADPLDGTTDGFWVDAHYSNSPAYVEDVTMKVWFTESVPLTLT